MQRWRHELCRHHNDTAEKAKHLRVVSTCEGPGGSARNRWREILQRGRRRLQGEINISGDSDLTAGCVPEPPTEDGEKRHSLTGEEPHDAPVPGKDRQLHQVAENAEDLEQELLVEKRWGNMSRVGGGRANEQTRRRERHASFSPSAPPCCGSC